MLELTSAPRITGVHLSHVVQLATTTPWAILPEKLAVLTELLQLRAAGERLTPEAIEERLAAERGPSAREAAASAPGQIAVIPIIGTLVPRVGAIAKSSGVRSTSDIVNDVRAAVEDENVRAVVLDIDSPGGVTTGIPEAADDILALRGTKPIVAVANDLMASAAYWLGSAADEIVATPTAFVGSIGVYMMHVDVSRAMANDGIDVTMVKAGKFKADTNPYQPLSAEAQARLQGSVDEMYDLFVDAVARQRGAKTAHVRAQYGEGATLTAQRAKAAGMIDRIESMRATLQRLSSASPPARNRSSGGRRADEPRTTSLIMTDDVPAAREGAAETMTPALETAPVAEEPAVKENLQAAPGGAAPPATASDTLELLALGVKYAHVVDTAKVDAWVRGGTSVAHAKDEILEILGSRARSDAPTTPARPGTSVRGVHNRAEDAPFASDGEFLLAVASAGRSGGAVDDRLRPLAAAAGVSQQDPTSAGFLVGSQMRDRLLDTWWNQPTDLVGMAEKIDVPYGFDSITFNLGRDDDRRNGVVYGGAQAYWINEADQINASTGKFRQVTVAPQELAALVYVTDKMLRNASVLEQWNDRWAGLAMAVKANLAVFGGDGVGKPSGLKESKAKVQVTRQTANRITSTDLSQMWSRVPAGARSRIVWLHNVECEPEFDRMSTVVTNVAGTENVGGYEPRVYNPERNTIKGRPMIACDFSEALGTEGDIIAFDPACYLVGLRAGGQVRKDISIHVKFIEAQSAFRYMTEIDGKCLLDVPLKPLKGTANRNLSPIVTLV
jgi:capsid assembly protease